MTLLTIIYRIPMLSILFSLVACGQKNKLSDDLKKGLLAFKINLSTNTEELADTVNSVRKYFGSAWVAFNEINVRTNQDTLLVDVNREISTSHNYDGGFEIIQDTLFLYAKNLTQEQDVGTIHSTLSYKILTNGQKYKEIKFRELK